MKAIILNYASSCVDTAVIPEGIEQTEQVEEYLSTTFNYNMDEISYMVVNDTDCPVYTAGEYATSLFI